MCYCKTLDLVELNSKFCSMDQYHSKSKHNPTNEFKDSMYTKRKMQEAIRGHL